MLDVMDKRQNKRLLATERGEPQRSGGEPNGGANNLAADSPIPDPEVLAKPQRRRFTPAYKAGVVEEAQRCTQSGELGALLRREGLYSSALTQGGRAGSGIEKGHKIIMGMSRPRDARVSLAIAVSVCSVVSVAKESVCIREIRGLGIDD